LKSEVFIEKLGLFMWRGLSIPAEISEHPSYEYH
jgi:hypothetical protein